MSRHRHHTDILIAGLILLGTMLWLSGIVHALVELSDPVRAIVWFASALFAAQLARGVLVDLDLSEVAITAAVTMLLVFGIHQHRSGAPLEVGLLLWIAIADIGALIGAWLGKRSGTTRMALMLAAGFGALGTGLLFVGAAMLVTESNGAYGGAMLGGAVVGAALMTNFTDARTADCAAGLALTMAVLFAWAAKMHWIQGLMFGFIPGGLLGALGGWIGGKVARGRRSKDPAELPEARVTSRPE